MLKTAAGVCDITGGLICTWLARRLAETGLLGRSKGRGDHQGLTQVAEHWVNRCSGKKRFQQTDVHLLMDWRWEIRERRTDAS